MSAAQGAGGCARERVDVVTSDGGKRASGRLSVPTGRRPRGCAGTHCCSSMPRGACQRVTSWPGAALAAGRLQTRRRSEVADFRRPWEGGSQGCNKTDTRRQCGVCVATRQWSWDSVRQPRWRAGRRRAVSGSGVPEAAKRRHTPLPCHSSASPSSLRHADHTFLLPCCVAVSGNRCRGLRGRPQTRVRQRRPPPRCSLATRLRS
jgi:hypothetical protein